jgi:hypothetical protein
MTVDVFPPTVEDGKPLCQSCQKAPARDHHECPYRVEINDDCTTMCNCCEACAHECAMDI